MHAIPVDLSPPLDSYRRADGCHDLRTWFGAGHSYGFDVPPRLRNHGAFRDALAQRYARPLSADSAPPVLQLWLWINESGRVANHRIKRGSVDPAFDAAASEALFLLQFRPARQNSGRVVPVWICRSIELAPHG